VLDVRPVDVRAWELNRPVDLGPSRHASRGSLRPGSRQHAEWAAHSRYSKKQPSPARLSRFWRSPFGACLPSPLASFLISLSSSFCFLFSFFCAFLPPPHVSFIRVCHREGLVDSSPALPTSGRWPLPRSADDRAAVSSHADPTSRHDLPDLHQWQYAQFKGARFTPTANSTANSTANRSSRGTTAALVQEGCRLGAGSRGACSTANGSAWPPHAAAAAPAAALPAARYLPQHRASGWRLAQANPGGNAAAASGPAARVPRRAHASDAAAAAVARHVRRQKAGAGQRALAWRGRAAHWQGIMNAIM
jgi:hypothetical protein